MSPALAEGSACRLSLPPGGEAAAASAALQVLRGEHHAPAFRHVSRMDLLHMRGLQALDALQAGCGHREIAEAVFGADAAAGRWHADSDLRAQMRHILSRAKALMAGGYLRLAGVRPG
ncbi:DNA -binding domain-containing protein [Acidovorax benzenivorans]|uniref:DNA -binding domain-containing protein n=1 Tax=Acidovorax benzenivorans TaxID=2987520 RepID=UPI0038992DB1